MNDRHVRDLAALDLALDSENQFTACLCHLVSGALCQLVSQLGEHLFFGLYGAIGPHSADEVTDKSFRRISSTLITLDNSPVCPVQLQGPALRPKVGTILRVGREQWQAAWKVDGGCIAPCTIDLETCGTPRGSAPYLVSDQPLLASWEHLQQFLNILPVDLRILKLIDNSALHLYGSPKASCYRGPGNLLPSRPGGLLCARASSGGPI
ncbi:hypothetical protein EDB84DRAFT_265977 [Lactarius hengduanensis]|nr:hypothetical protein EDB84DRAFT_265977 [Lactarius hengduanensis]